MPHLGRHWPHALLVAGVALGIAVLADAAPLTYDEAYNRLVYGRLGVVGILTPYDAPNNHLIFTVLQSLLPRGLLAWNPWTIRIFGVASGVAIVAALVGVAAVRPTTPLLGLAVVAGSPLLVTYLFVARGYTFAAVFLVAAAGLPVVVRRRNLGVCLGALALALGTWPLPTDVFVAAGWILVVLAIRGLRAALTGAAVYAGVLALMFGPIAGQLWTQAKYPWNAHQHWWSWVGDLFSGMSLVPVCLVLVALIALAALGSAPPLARLALAMSGSWFALVALTHAAGLHLPFTRTAVPALWLGVVGVVAPFPRGRLEYVAVALLMPALGWGVLMWWRAVHDGDWKDVARRSRNDVLYGTTPATIRDLPSIGADRIACGSYGTWVCELVAPSLAGVTVSADDSPYDASLRCALGSRRPPAPFQVSVYRGGRLLGVHCH